MRTGKRLSINNIKRIALELGRTKNAKELADELGFNYSTIMSAKKNLIRKGIKFPEMPGIRYSNYPVVIKGLKETHPELFN